MSEAPLTYGEAYNGLLMASSATAGWRGLVVEHRRLGDFDEAFEAIGGAELILMLRGGGRVTRSSEGDAERWETSAGLLCLTPPGRADRVGVEGQIETVHVYLDGAMLREAAERDLEADSGRVELRYQGGWRDPLAEQLVHAMHGELRRPGFGGEVYRETLNRCLAVHLLRDRSGLPARRAPPVVAENRRVRRALDLIEARLAAPLTLEVLAEAACLSPWHFARVFKATVGEAPHAYLSRRRVEEARRLLRVAPDLTIAEIAYACGFASQSHFTAAFKKQTGATPKAYRHAAS